VCDAQWREDPISQVWVFVAPLLAGMQYFKLLVSTFFPLKDIRMEFRENSYRDFLFVPTELNSVVRVCSGYVRLHAPVVDGAIPPPSHITNLSVRSAALNTCEKFLSMKLK
jgi:hypothetical protein